MASPESTRARRAVNLAIPVENDLTATLVGITLASISVAPVPELDALELIVRDRRDGAETRALLSRTSAAGLTMSIFAALNRLAKEGRP